jgi:hypothetical protein
MKKIIETARDAAFFNDRAFWEWSCGAAESDYYKGYWEDLHYISGCLCLMGGF